MKVSLRLNLIIAVNSLQLEYYTGGGFDNWLDAVDASFCGGDDPTQASAELSSSLTSPHSREFLFQDGIYPDPAPGGFNGRHFVENMVSQCN